MLVRSAGVTPPVPLRLLVVGGIVAAAFAAGAAHVAVPFLGPALILGVVAVPLLMRLEPGWVALAAVGAALFAPLLRLLGAPGLVTYAHYALAPALLVLLLARPRDVAADRLVLASIGFGGAILLSASVTSWTSLRPLLLWLTYAEPYLVMAGLSEASPTTRRIAWQALVAFAAIQVPLASAQAAAFGIGDDVQGTLLGVGAGAHLLGSIALVGVALVLAGLPVARQSRGLVLALVAGFLLTAALADAKQVITVFAVAALPFAARQLGTRRAVAVVGAVVGVAALLWWASTFNASLGRATDEQVIRSLGTVKLERTSAVLDRLEASGWVFGLGPGQGLSRVALATSPLYGSVPAAVVGSPPAELASEELRAWDPGPNSSSNSPFSSWLGLVTDIGLVGTASYLAMALAAWVALGRGTDALQATAGRVVLLAAALLGMTFLWLGEPAFVLYAGAALGTMIGSHPRPASRGRR